MIMFSGFLWIQGLGHTFTYFALKDFQEKNLMRFGSEVRVYNAPWSSLTFDLACLIAGLAMLFGGLWVHLSPPV